MKLNLTKNLKRLLFTAAVWLCIAVATVGFDWYFLTLVQDNAAQLEASKETTATLEAKRVLLLKEREHIKIIEPDIAKIQNVFVDSGNPLGFIEELEGIAKANAVTLKLGVPQKTDHTLVMQIEAGGGLSDALTFSRKIESLPQQVVFDDVTFEKIAEKPLAGAGPQSKTPSSPRVRIFGTIEFLAK